MVSLPFIYIYIRACCQCMTWTFQSGFWKHLLAAGLAISTSICRFRMKANVCTIMSYWEIRKMFDEFVRVEIKVYFDVVHEQR